MPNRSLRALAALVLGTVCAAGAAVAADVTAPAEVSGLTANRSGGDLAIDWDAVTTDAAGNAETVDHYAVYRGTSASFVPDRDGGSNRIGTSTTTSYTDVGAAAAAGEFYYRVSAVDTQGNESVTKPSAVTTPPVLSGTWTDASIDLTWTDALPADRVVGYRVYYGVRPWDFSDVVDVGLVNGWSLTGLQPGVNYYAAVTAIDDAGNESGFSNQHVDVVGGRIVVRAHDDDYLCWGASKCPPPDPADVQRADGWQLMVPVDFPEGDWTRVLLTFTIDSRLCEPPAQGTTDKCGGTNPGGYNPCGDPWDRIAHVFLVLDDCIAAGGSCVTNDNLELMRAITPFGTDAPPPDGSGVVPPRVLTLDITPYARLLTGRRYVGAEIGHYVQAGWHVTTEFEFSKRPEEVSPKPPADGVQVLFFDGVPPPTRTVTIPPAATKVVTRLFTTGHGGNQYCDGGSNDGGACTSSSQCPGGSCQNCDEFCHRVNRILRDGTPIWQTTPWRDCCVPAYPGDPFCQGCASWNACGYPSCTFDRAGWCPGYIACHADGNCDQDIDQTASLPAGGTYDIDYDVLVQRGSWSVSLVLYWYE